MTQGPGQPYQPYPPQQPLPQQGYPQQAYPQQQPYAQQQPYPQQPLAHIRLHVQGSIWTSSMLTPTVTINGHPVPASYGENLIPVYPGRCVVEAKAHWMRTYGHAAYTVDLGPGQVADVWYAAPMTQFQDGSMGPVKQSRKGVGVFVGILAVIFAFAIVLPLMASLLSR